MIVYWNFVYISKESGKQVKPEANKYPAGEIIKKAFLKYYNVFNIEDTENIPYTSPEPLQRTEKEKIEICEQIIQNYPGSPKIDFGGNRACYTPLKDIVRMPFIEDFEQSESYYSVLFHELIHSTGHQTRLNREGIATISGFGTEDYSKEELVAELGAAFLCGVSSIIPTTLNLSAAYIQNWLQILKNDKKFIIEAAQKAQKATDHILNTESISSSEEEGE